MLRNAMGSFFLASSISLAEAESAFAATESDGAFGGAVSSAESVESAPIMAKPVDSFLSANSVDSGTLISHTPSWLCPTAAVLSLAGLYALRRRANVKREREESVIREVRERLAQAGSPQALLKAESDKAGKQAYLHSPPIATLREARQVLSAYAELEKIQFYLETVPPSQEAKTWGREALRIRSNLLAKLRQYLDHCRGEILASDFATPRHIKHFLVLYAAYHDFLKDVALHKSALTGQQTGLARQGEDIFLILQRYYRICVSQPLRERI